MRFYLAKIIKIIKRYNKQTNYNIQSGRFLISFVNQIGELIPA